MRRITITLLLLVIVCALSVSGSYAFELNGFADISYSKSEDAPAGTKYENGDFAFGTLDLYLAQSLDDIEVLVELIVEKGDVLDLERITVGYAFNDALRIRGGRFHTPLGYWNTAFHHGVELQPTIIRPEFLNFEDDGGILPVHTIGLYLSGRVRTAVGVVEYGALLGNGPKVTGVEGEPNVLFPNNIEDDNTIKAVAFNAGLSPAVVRGLKVGVSGHISRVQDDGNIIKSDGSCSVSLTICSVDVDQTVLSADIRYSIQNVGLAAEYFSIKDEDKGSGNLGSFDNSAYYGLITYTFQDKWVPYILYEDMSLEENKDPYLIALRADDVTKTSAGLRYNISYRSSLKGEFRSVEKGGNDWNEYAVQWAVAF